MTYNTIPLHQTHLDLGAKMSPFAGFLMPISYPQGLIHEHLHTRSDAGFFDLSHMGQLLISGQTAAQELENLTPSNITGLQSGQQKYTVFTNASGGIIDDVIITRLAAKFSIIVNAACKDKDLLHLRSHLSSACQIEEQTQHVLFALQGPKAAEILRHYCPAVGQLKFMHACYSTINDVPCLVSRCGYTGEDGFEISLEKHDAKQLADLLLAHEHIKPIGLGARNTLRLEAGLCLYGHELNETITPVEAGLHWIVKKQHKNFPGADIIFPQWLKQPDWIRVGLLISGKIPVRDGTEIFNSNHALIGQISSGSFAPSVGQPIAMARLNRQLFNTGETLYSMVRNKKINLSLTTLPFIAHHTIG